MWGGKVGEKLCVLNSLGSKVLDKALYFGAMYVRGSYLYGDILDCEANLEWVSSATRFPWTMLFVRISIPGRRSTSVLCMKSKHTVFVCQSRTARRDNSSGSTMTKVIRRAAIQY